ncbi:tyrosine-type recombinase/integrase [Acaryochloris marina]|uniref:tyrosine-type recombinase/integrase n=1 Tax=Acaryochloris marina TaxID=155978 RepID=UPI0021C46DC9|nr:tyrosine-type recombinase/integrase [Acaryochloris marina]BDM82925.1 tyrosine recombinase XerC [Acaryochloris marina MBIC10699]
MELDAIPTPPASALKILENDVLSDLLRDKRSPSTRRAYRKDLTDFFRKMFAEDPTPEMVGLFLGMDRHEALQLVARYKGILIELELAEATVNRRLSALRSLVSYARRAGQCTWGLEDIKGEKVIAYRDTSGVDLEDFQKMLAIPDRETQLGKRDYAILALLWETALRRGELNRCNVGDWEPEEKTLWIQGKGRGTQKERVTVGNVSAIALEDWLSTRKHLEDDDPLIVALDIVHWGQRLSTTSIYKVVRNIATKAGISKVMSPHRVRHSSITAALDATGGNVRAVQQLSRHAKPETVMRYDDNRKDLQGEVTGVLSRLLGEAED